MFFWSPSFIDSYYSVNPVWQNILKKNTDSLKHISRTSLGNIFVVYFRDKLDFVHTFTLSMLVHLVGQKIGRKHHDEKSLDFANVFYIFFSWLLYGVPTRNRRNRWRFI